MSRDLVTSTPADAEKWERAHAPEIGLREDWERDDTPTRPVEPCACNKPHCLMCALERVFAGWTP